MRSFSPRRPSMPVTLRGSAAERRSLEGAVGVRLLACCASSAAHPSRLPRLEAGGAPQDEGASVVHLRPQILTSVQPALVQHPGLHDQGEMFPLIAVQRKVFQWIAVDHDYVCKGARRQRPHLAGPAQDLGADRGGRADDLDRRNDFLADDELARLVPVQLAQEIAAIGDRNAVALADLQRSQPALQHDLVLGEALAGHAPLRRPLLHGVVGDEVRDEVHPLPRHRARAVVVDEVAVLDGANAEARGALDRLGRVGVRADVAPEGGRLLHGGADFAAGELRLSSGSYGDATPPDIMIFTWSAPWRI